MEPSLGAEETRIFVISGTQGAGKSTVARMLASRFGRGVHVEADTLQGMIVSGGKQRDPSRLAPDGSVVGEAARQLRLRLHHACLLAPSSADAGFTAVVDDIVAPRVVVAPGRMSR